MSGDLNPTPPAAARVQRSRLAPVLTTLAVQALPDGSVRERYRQEFAAELHGMAPRAQLKHAFQIVLTIGALRAAVAGRNRPSTSEALAAAARRRPLLCRLNLHHRWRRQSNEDGERFTECELCRKMWDGPDRLFPMS